MHQFGAANWEKNSKFSEFFKTVNWAKNRGLHKKSKPKLIVWSLAKILEHGSRVEPRLEERVQLEHSAASRWHCALHDSDKY